MRRTNSNGSPLAGGRLSNGSVYFAVDSSTVTVGDLVERLLNPTSIYCTLGHSIFNDHTVYLAKDT